MASSTAIVAGKIQSGLYKELEDLNGGCDDRGEWENKSYLVPWDKRSEFIRDFKGVSSISGGSTGKWSAQVPYALPDNPRLYVRDITFTPEGALVPGVTPIRFTHARMNVVFRQPDFNYQGFDDPGDQNSFDPGNDGLLFATQELDFGKDWQKVPESSLKFKSDDKDTHFPINRSITVISMHITWHRFPLMPLPLLRVYCDSLNDATFLGCPKGTIHFQGARTTRTATETSSGSKATQEVQMVFSYRAIDWNKYLREDGLSWDFVVSKNYAGGPTGNHNGFSLYPYRDFSKLLLGSAQLASGLMSPLSVPPEDSL